MKLPGEFIQRFGLGCVTNMQITLHSILHIQLIPGILQKPWTSTWKQFWSGCRLAYTEFFKMQVLLVGRNSNPGFKVSSALKFLQFPWLRGCLGAGGFNLSLRPACFLPSCWDKCEEPAEKGLRFRGEDGLFISLSCMKQEAQFTHSLVPLAAVQRHKPPPIHKPQRTMALPSFLVY